MIEIILTLFAVTVISYLIGSIPTGYIVVKLLTGQDIRTTGSGSTGATNVKRVLGKKWFFAVMVFDAVKGALPVISAELFICSGADMGLFPVLAAIGVIMGHSKPLFLNFKGGKSVASGVGTILALNWQTGLAVAVIWGIITYFTRYVSLGSIIAVILSPFLMHYIGHAPACYTGYCVLGAVYIVYLHRQNIVRLLHGEESKVR